MEFDYDEGELEIIAEAGRAVRELFPVERFRADDSDGHCAAWLALDGLGWLSAAVPEESGGGGLSAAVVAGVMREAGRVLLVDCFVDNAYIIPMLAASGGGLAVAAFPGFVWVDARSPSLVAEPAAKSVVAAGALAGRHAYVIESNGARLGVHPPLDAATRAAAGLALTRARVDRPGAPVAEHELDADLDELVATAGVYQAAALVGLAEEALVRTVAYARERVQFGAPIGSFQAVKHGLADVLARNETAWGSVLYAAALARDSPERRPAQLAARIGALRAADEATRAMSQFFGGIGYTWESDVHWFLKTRLDASQRWGGIDTAARLLGEVLVGQC